jgi:putative heme-binding domain-containing protein
VLLAIPKLEGPEALEVLVKLASQYDGSDRYQLEAINIAAAGRKESLYEELKKRGRADLDNIALVQLLNPFAAAELLRAGVSTAKTDDERSRLLIQLALSTDPQAGRMLVQIAGDSSASAALRVGAIELLAANLSGPWRGLTEDAEFLADLKRLLSDPATQLAALDMISDQKLRELGEDVLALTQNNDVPQAVKAKALAVLVKVRPGSAAKLVAQMLRSPDAEERSTGIATLIELQDWPAIKRELFKSDGDALLQEEAVDRMAATTGGALALLRWIDKNEISETLKRRSVAQAINHPDAAVRVMYERFVPEDQRPQRLGAAIKAADILALKGDPKRGEQIFYQSTAAQCKNCHQVNGRGASIGPDLSAIGKKYERATLLETILDPSKAISHEYVPYLVQTNDGLIYAGFLAENSEREVVVKDIKGALTRIKRKDIELIEPQTKSLMPELVLRDVTAQDAADLLAFMETLTSPSPGR